MAAGHVEGLVRSAAVDDDGRRRVPLLIDRSGPYGPATRRRQIRTAGVYAVVALLGVAPVLLGGSPRLQAFGAGLVFPGAGMFYPSGLGAFFANLAWFGGVIAALSIAFVIWFASGNILLPAAVWLAAAVIAALRTTDSGHTWLAPAVLAFVIAVVVRNIVKAHRDFRRHRQVVRARNREFAQTELPGRPSFIVDKQFVGEEIPVEDLKFLRYPLELALQPVDSFWGFDQSEQFQGQAVRYQINFIGYLLSICHYSRMPAFHGYMARAQRKLIEKMLVPQVWKYWRLENMWGNLRVSPDPVVRDNVMLTGYWGLQIGMYESITGDRRYREPGSLPFVWKHDRVFAHSLTTVNEALHKNFLRYDYGYFPCEPNWIYPLCNAEGILSLIINDRLQGSHLVDDIVDAYRRAHEIEFVSPGGNPVLRTPDIAQ